MLGVRTRPRLDALLLAADEIGRRGQPVEVFAAEFPLAVFARQEIIGFLPRPDRLRRGNCPVAHAVRIPRSVGAIIRVIKAITDANRVNPDRRIASCIRCRATTK
jgi:hypothetical protein